MKTKQFWLWFLGLWVVAGLPLFLLHGVPGTDTPNHVARLHILAHPEQFVGSYEPHWKLVPNLAIDLLIVPVLKATGIDALLLMKVFLFNVFGLFGFGFALVNRAMSGKWQPIGLAGFLFCYSYTLGFGFVNYLFGISVGLCLVGGQLLLQYKPLLRFSLLGLGLPLLTIFHLMGFGFAALSILVLAILSKDRQDRTRFFWGGWIFGCLMAVVLVKSSSADPVGLGFSYGNLPDRFRNLFFPLHFSGLARDVLFWLAAVVLVLWSSFLRKNNQNREALLILVFGLVFVGCLPHMLMGSAFLAARSSLWVFLLGFALLKDCRIGLATVVCLIGVRSVDVSTRFLSWNPLFDELRQDLAKMSALKGETPFMLYQFGDASALPLSPIGWNPSILHADCLAVLDRPGYVSNIFAFEGEQPIQVYRGTGERFHSKYFYTDRHAELLMDDIQARRRKQSADVRSRPAFLYVPKSPSRVPPVIDARLFINRPRYAIYELLP